MSSFSIPQNYVEIFSNLSSANSTAVIITVVTILVLYINNELLKPKINKLCILPVPIELIAVVTGTLISRFLDLSNNYGIKTIGNIPTGFPGLFFLSYFIEQIHCFFFF